MEESYSARTSAEESSHTLLPPEEHAEAASPTLSRTESKRVGWFGLLPAAFVFIISLGLGSTLLFWLLAHQVHSLQDGFLAAIRNGTFYVDEGSKKTADGDPVSLMWGLTFSSTAVSPERSSRVPADLRSPCQSHLISITSSFLMTLVAFRIAGEWKLLEGRKR